MTRQLALIAEILGGAYQAATEEGRPLSVHCHPRGKRLIAADQPAGEIEAENLTLACRNAVLNMMELLQERGFTRQQAYVICSVAVDLRVSNVVDVPNYVVSALLPEAIFDGE